MYDHPDNIFVAGFIGSPAMNLLNTQAVDGGVKLGDTVYPVAREVLGQGRQEHHRWACAPRTWT